MHTTLIFYNLTYDVLSLVYQTSSNQSLSPAS